MKSEEKNGILAREFHQRDLKWKDEFTPMIYTAGTEILAVGADGFSVFWYVFGNSKLASCISTLIEAGHIKSRCYLEKEKYIKQRVSFQEPQQFLSFRC